MTLLFIEQLTVADFSYLDSKRGLIGETWLVDVEIEGTLDNQGMVMDFSLLKQKIKKAVDTLIDHRLLVPIQADSLQYHESDGYTSLRFPFAGNRHIHLKTPSTAISPIPAKKIDTQTVATHLESLLHPTMDDNVVQMTIRLHPEHIEGAYYHYSHGLKLHSGRCQRIAHGHRSRIQITRNGRTAPELESRWAERWRDIYLADQEDLIDDFDEAGVLYFRFGYQANEGFFSLVIPADRCYLIAGDTTVENLAQHILQKTQQEEPGENLEVRAYEGMNKGAISHNL